MIPCISQATTLPSTFAQDVAAFASAGFTAVELWLTKLETHLKTTSADDTRKQLADLGLVPLAAAYQGGLLLSQGEQRQAHFEHFRQRLEMCQALGVRTLLLVADFARKVERTDLERAIVSLAQAGQWAAGFGVRLALEFRSGDAFCTSLDTACALAAQAGEPNVGVCLDVFHYTTGPSKSEDLDLLTPANLFHVQVCDVAGVVRELASDADRIFPGEGDFRLAPVFRRLRMMDYPSGVSLEMMNPTVWQAMPEQVAELGLASLRRLMASE